MKHLSWILLVCTPMACAPEETRSELKVEAAVTEQLAARRETFWRECLSEAVERASDTVDSLLLARAHESYLIDMKAPPRPDRPDIQAPEIEGDSIPLTPLLPEKKR